MYFRKKLSISGSCPATLFICTTFLNIVIPSQLFAQVCHQYTMEKPDVTTQYKSAVTAGVKRYRSLYPEIIKRRYRWEFVEGSEHNITHSCSVTIKPGIKFEVFFEINMRDPANGEVAAISARQEILDGRAIRMSTRWDDDWRDLYPKPGRPKPAEDLQHCLQNGSRYITTYKYTCAYNSMGERRNCGDVANPYGAVQNYVKNTCNFDVVLREKSDPDSRRSDIKIPKGQEISANERNLWWVYRK